MLGGIAAAVAVVLFVTAHEAGHFFAAKAVGMKATEFFFGFGPKIWSTTKGETEYGFKWIPLGGYVKILGMNPLEEVAPQDVSRTYRGKKFWEKSLVVLAGVGMNFLIGFLLFYGLILANGVAGDPLPVVGQVVVETELDGRVVTTPASQAGIREGDVILAIGPHQVEAWADVPEALRAEGPGPSTVTVQREGETVLLDVNLARGATTDGAVTGFLGIAPVVEMLEVGPVEAVGVSGQLVWRGITNTFDALYQMIQPSSLAQYVGVLLGDTDIETDIRPVSPIGIVNIGSQAETAASFLGVLALVNVILATINLLPLFPLDGGHFAVAVYEKLTGREADIRRLVPVAAAVIGLFIFLGFVAIVLDLTNPLNL